MRILKRLMKLEGLKNKQPNPFKNIIKRPRSSREEWLKIRVLENQGVGWLEARKQVYAARNDNDETVNSPYWELMKQWSEAI